MARTRRAAQSAPQEVLVPEAEQPYAVPENWRWVRLGSTITLYRGVTYKKSDAHTSKQPNDCLILRGGNIQDGIINFFNDNIYVDMSFVKPEQLLQKNDIVIVTSTGSYKVIGKSAAVQEDFRDVAFGAFLTLARPLHIYNKVYIYYFFQSVFFREHLRRLASGTSINNLKTAHITECVFPLPPRAEQERIVARIESLFARLDKARGKVDAVLGRCAARKAALLHKAFSGELTAAWRKARGIGLESWEEKLSGQLFSYVTSGSRGWAKYYSEEGALFIRMGNLSHETIELNLSEVQHVKLPDDIEGQRSKLKNNDILISITADVGMVALVRDINFEGYINQHVALARPVSTVCPEFLALYLISDAGKKELKARQRGSTKVGLGLDDIKSLHLKMPTLAEQAEIVRILDELLARERRAQEAAERVAARIEQIKRAVLTKAFRGELGTNDPAEPAALTEQGSLSLA